MEDDRRNIGRARVVMGYDGGRVTAVANEGGSGKGNGGRKERWTDRESSRGSLLRNQGAIAKEN